MKSFMINLFIHKGACLYKRSIVFWLFGMEISLVIKIIAFIALVFERCSLYKA
ncbi:hypothetical protein CLU79DRAFT_732019 [Phycomyces nitens]|nr:hypothetical protein CLU79DRAFT_732019 [Phycomyces nitens]